VTAPDRSQRRLRLGTNLFDPRTLELSDREGQPIPLREKSRRVLAELAARNGETVDRDALIHAAWGGRAVSDDNLVQCVKDIRTALGDHDRQVLRTAFARGYSLNGVLEMPSGAGSRPTLLISSPRVNAWDPDLVELAEIIAEELVLALAPRTGFRITTDEARRDTVRFALEGRMSRSGPDIRLFMQLLEAGSGDVAFAETWCVPQAEADALPRPVADRIANLLRVHMFNHAGEDFVERGNANLTTQELLAKAAFHMSRIRIEDRDAARAALTLAVDREPANAMALAMRASTGVISILQEGYARLPDTQDVCVDLADRAVGIAPHVDFVMLTRGCLRLWLKADHAAARSDFRRALEINPVFHLAHQFMATSEILSGEQEAGLRRMQKVLDLGSSRNPRHPHYLALIALGHLLAGRDDEAAEISTEAHARAPGDPWCVYVHAAAAAHRDEIAASREFRQMIAATDLPFRHFRDLPFTDPADVNLLEERLGRAGYPDPA
jgi:DNA-binding winged helix-turn-helix (wHTH) protein/tetratricopeptide (TPR) repeat protein